jgi:hypothetical protein
VTVFHHTDLTQRIHIVTLEPFLEALRLVVHRPHLAERLMEELQLDDARAGQSPA